MQNELKLKLPQAAEIKPLSPSARRNARHYALQAMYLWEMTGAATIDIEKEFLQYHIRKKYDLDYFKELLHGIPENTQEIDQAIKLYVGRAMEEIDPIEHAVLRLSVYELLKRPDVPYRVVINEALELTKKFGSIEGYKFVNGILDRIAKMTRTAEISSEKI